MIRFSIVIATVIFLHGCSTVPVKQYAWKKPNVDELVAKNEEGMCKAYGYSTAGPMPRSESMPSYSRAGGGFAGGLNHGYAMGSVASRNRAARQAWDDAYQSVFEACMYQYGYSLVEVTQ